MLWQEQVLFYEEHVSGLQDRTEILAAENASLYREVSVLEQSWIFLCYPFCFSLSAGLHGYGAVTAAGFGQHSKSGITRAAARADQLRDSW